MKKIVLFSMLFLGLVEIFAQTTPTVGPNGIRVPNFTQTNRLAISSPSTGLIVYQTDGTTGYYVYTGSEWLRLLDSNTSTGVTALDGLTDSKVEGTDFTGSMILGHQTTGTLDAATNNTAIGLTALNSITSGDYNSVLGNSAGKMITTGSENVYLGYSNSINSTTSSYNVVVGSNATQNLNGNYNTYVGSYIGINSGDMTGTLNASLGSYNFTNITSGEYNTGVGSQVGQALTTGSNNTLIGNSAGNIITTGSNNTLIGKNTNLSSATLSNATAIGYNATVSDNNKIQLGDSDITSVSTYGSITAGAVTYPNTDGTSGQVLSTNGSGTLSWASISAADKTLSNLTSASTARTNLGLAIGTDVQAYDADLTDLADGTLTATKVENGTYFISSAGTNGQVWTSDGSGAGAWSSSSSGVSYKSEGSDFAGSLIIGHSTTGTLSLAQYNTAIGLNAMDAITTGDDNVAVGNSALTSTTTGTGNTAIGYTALNSNTTGGRNSVLGREAAYSNTTGDYNVALGHQAGYSNSTGASNIFIGYQAGYNETGSDKLYIDNSNTSSPLIYGNFSSNALTINGTLASTGTLTVGAYTLPSTDGSANQVLKTNGSGTLSWTTVSGSGATALDGLSDVKYGGTDFSGSLLIGSESTGTLSSASNNTGVGASVFSNLTSGLGNSAFGNSALSSLTSANSNTAFGYAALESTTTGGNNTAVGGGALRSNTTGQENNAIGASSLYSNTTGIYNNSFGGHALFNNTTGSYNNAFGYSALGENTTASSNNAFGYYALSANTTGGNNTAMGDLAMNGNTEGNDNTAIGVGALMSNNTGSYNTAIGSGADVSTGGISNSTALGFGATVTTSNTVQLGSSTVTSVNTSGVVTSKGMILSNTTNSASTLKFNEPSGSGSNYTAFKAQAQSADVTYILPSADGSSGQFLATNGSGTLSWASAGTSLPSFLTKTASYTITSSDCTNGLVLISNAASPTYTLPAANSVTSGQVIRISGLSGGFTITRSGSDTLYGYYVNGSSTGTCYSATLISDGTSKWYITDIDQ